MSAVMTCVLILIVCLIVMLSYYIIRDYFAHLKQFASNIFTPTEHGNVFGRTKSAVIDFLRTMTETLCWRVSETSDV